MERYWKKPKIITKYILKRGKEKTPKYHFLKCIKALLNNTIYNYRLSTFILDLFPHLKV